MPFITQKRSFSLVGCLIIRDVNVSSPKKDNNIKISIGIIPSSPIDALGFFLGPTLPDLTIGYSQFSYLTMVRGKKMLQNEWRLNFQNTLQPPKSEFKDWKMLKTELKSRSRPDLNCKFNNLTFQI